MSFQRNINVKAITSGEREKSYASNLLVSIKQFMVASNILVLLMLERSSLPYKGFHLAGHYKNQKYWEQYN